MNKLLIIFLLPFLFFLQGCGAGKTVVLERPGTTYKIKSLAIVSDMSTTDVPLKVQQKFEANLQNKLYKNQTFAKGNDLTIHYRFVQLDEGSQLSRWFFGGIGNAGEGSLTVEASFVDKNGKALGKVHTEGKIGSGVLGGGFDLAIEKASQHLAEYVTKNFKSS